MGTFLSDRHRFEKYDPWLAHAIDEIESTFGHVVRVKPKSLMKFGRTNNADNDVLTTVATFQGSEVNETFATGNTIDSVISDDAADDGKTVTIEGHTVDGSGNLTFVVQTATLGNVTRTALATSLYRATRIYKTPGSFASPVTALAGNVYVYDNTVAAGHTSGTPDNATATKVMISAGNQQSEKCATSLSSVDCWILTRISAGLSRGGGNAVNADIEVEWREQGGVFRPQGIELALRTSALTFYSIPLKPYRVIPPNSDIRMITLTDTANTTVQGAIAGVLAIVQPS